jgi:DNA-binding transcriptional MerR regulator
VAVTDARGLSISEAARATGVSAHTLRYYERTGLMLDPVDRAESTHRRYSERDIDWVVLLTRMRKTGMPIRLVRRYAELVREGDGNEAERLALLEEHRRGVLKQLEEVAGNLEAIDYKIRIYRERLNS